VSQDRYNRIEQRYLKYWKNNKLGNRIVLIAFFFFVGILVLLSVIPSIPSEVRMLLGLPTFGIMFGALLWAIRVQQNGRKFLPSVEDRVFYFVSTALSDLKLFASSGGALEKESALESLTKAAATIDSWTWGNLKFLNEGVGKAISEFRTNFRGRLIPAIGRADKKGIQSFFLNFIGLINALELGQLDQVHIEGWNRWLTQKTPPDFSKETFPYQAPPLTRFRRLASKKFHFSIAILVLAAPIVTGLVGVYVVQIPPEAAYQDAAIVFSGMIILLAYLIFGRQKSS
jgi:hypothetical protein